MAAPADRCIRPRGAGIESAKIRRHGVAWERNMLERVPAQPYRELEEITMKTDTRDILSHATKQAEAYEDYFLVDIDAHVTETQFWPEIIAMIDNDVIR